MLNKLTKLMTCASFFTLAVFGLWSCEQEPVIIDVTDIDINVTSATLSKGETMQLTAVVVPSNATETAIEWVSVDQTIVKVDMNGLVTALNKGETVVMARSGNVVKECKITVLPIYADGISLDKDVLDMKVGDNARLAATVTPDIAEDKTVMWSTLNPTVASVDATGMVLAKASGQTAVIASCGNLSDTCKVFVMGDPQIGDFYYPDGRWFTSPIEGITPVGIVFYVGDPTKDDLTLKADHPECTHGLALALFEEKSSIWQPKAKDYGKLVDDWAKQDAEASKCISVHQGQYGDYLNKAVGYNNTKVYRLFNADEANSAWPVEAVKVVDDYNEECPLPETTSGWYIPSAKELSLMCSGEYDGNIGSMNESQLNQEPLNEMINTLNQKMFEIPGAYLFSPNWYLSSTEADIVKQMYTTDYNQWHIKMGTGYIFNQNKTTSEQAIRPVFAF